MSKSKCCGYPVHEAATLFPLLPKQELDELAEDIKQHGLLHPVVTLKGKLLDGRNRLLACELANVEPVYREYCGIESPVEYVLAANLKRRHLTPSQRAAIAVSALPLFEVEARKRQTMGVKAQIPEGGQARDKAAAVLKVSPRYVQDAKRIKTKSPETFEQIANGRKTIPEARRELWELNKTPAPKEHDPEDDESDTLFQLKRYWRKASKRDRASFLRWVKTLK